MVLGPRIIPADSKQRLWLFLTIRSMWVLQTRLTGAQVWSFDNKSWKQENSSGFGLKDNVAISAMTVHENILYAGTTNAKGGEIWAFDGQEWRCIHSGSFGDLLSKTISSMIVYKGKLYVGAVGSDHLSSG